jgi:hypothetical protein
MQQFEDLMDAASSTGPAGSPLPLFYALSQAGRAILATREEDETIAFPKKEGHGLTVPREAVGEDDLMTTVVKPMSSEGHFQRVARATGSPIFTGEVTLGALLASLPETGDELWNDERWPTAIRMTSLMDLAASPTLANLVNVDLNMFQSGILRLGLVTERISCTEDLVEFVELYPGLKNRRARLPPWLSDLRTWQTPVGPAVEVHLSVKPNLADPIRAQEALLDEIGPRYRWTERRWLRPAIEDGPLPSPLMTWWAVLLTLSSLARYHPTAWTHALEKNRSPVAVVLERTIDIALEAVPHLVFEAVGLAGGAQLLLPPGPDTPPRSR